MKKIALINLYSGINNRGAESFMHPLAQRLSKQYSTTLISGGPVNLDQVENLVIKSWVHQPSHNLTGNIFAKILKILFLDLGNLSVLFFSLKIFGLLVSQKYDVVIPSNGFWQVIVCKLVSVLAGSKILIVGHSGPGIDEKWNLWLKPDTFVATTGPTGDWAKKTAVWTRVEFIPYGIDVERFVNAKKVKMNLETPIVLCPAAAVAYKRVNLTIDAMKGVSGASLLHLGDGPLIESVKSYGAQLLGGRFESKSVSNDQMPDYYKTCDLVTLASMPQENSPMVFLEAMAAGKKVVCTDSPRNRWLLGECGIFVDPTDVNSYAQAIKDGLKEKNPDEVLKFVSKYDWKNIEKQYYSVIETLFESK